jgi:hypothetical protein
MSGLTRICRMENRNILGSMRKQEPSRSCLVGIIGVLTVAGVLWGMVEESHADPQGLNMTTLSMLQPGQVNANHGQVLVIDNKQYPVSPSVIVTDDEGRTRNLNEVVSGTQVRIHLRNDQIDQLVIMLPR